MKTGQLQSECIWATTLPFELWVDGRMGEHVRGEGAKAMHVRPTMLASRDKLWISLFFGVERCDSIHNNNEDNNNDDNNDGD